MGLPAQALGLSLHGSAVLLEIGSNFVVKSHQKRTISEITARMGGFFAGGGVSGGRDLKLPPRQVGVLFCFLAAKAAPLRGKISRDFIASLEKRKLNFSFCSLRYKIEEHTN